MDIASIPALCEEIAKSVATLKSQANHLLQQFADLDATARELLDDPYINGVVASRCPTEQAREGLRYFLLDELHALMGMPPPRREIYFVAGHRVVNGPALGSLPERILPSLEKVERRVAKARGADRPSLQTSANGDGGGSDLQSSANQEREEANLQTSAKSGGAEEE